MLWRNCAQCVERAECHRWQLLENTEVSGVIHCVSWLLLCLCNPAHGQQPAMKSTHAPRSPVWVMSGCCACLCVHAHMQHSKQRVGLSEWFYTHCMLEKSCNIFIYLAQIKEKNLDYSFHKSLVNIYSLHITVKCVHIHFSCAFNI